jgi:hypothetical protein
MMAMTTWAARRIIQKFMPILGHLHSQGDQHPKLLHSLVLAQAERPLIPFWNSGRVPLRRKVSNASVQSVGAGRRLRFSQDGLGLIAKFFS